MEPPGRLYFDGEEVFTDWFPRGGDGAIFRFEVIDRDGGIIALEVFSKNNDQTGQGAAVTGWSVTGANTVDRYQFIKAATATGGGGIGLSELVRLKISATGGAGKWALVRIFPPIFFDAAN